MLLLLMSLGLASGEGPPAERKPSEADPDEVWYGGPKTRAERR